VLKLKADVEAASSSRSINSIVPAVVAVPAVIDGYGCGGGGGGGAVGASNGMVAAKNVTVSILFIILILQLN